MPVVQRHDLRHCDREQLMTFPVLQNGLVVLVDGKVGTGQECCCPPPCVCPDLESLCISVTLTDYDGNVYNADQNDMIWFDGIGSIYFKGFEYSVSIACSNGVITVIAGWVGFPPDCICTSGGCSTSYACDGTADWYADTASCDLAFDNIGVPCGDGCPANLGNVTVTISDPPC